MNAYCDRQSVDLNSIAFLFDGRRLRGDQTPDEVNTVFPLDFLSAQFHDVAFLTIKNKMMMLF